MNNFNLTNRSNADVYNETSDLAGLKSVILHFQVSFLAFTIFAALLGNLVVLVATYLDKRLHNASKYFVACLATSDLLVAMFSVTIRLHQYLQQDRPLTIEFCRFWIWVDIFGEAASITCLDRFGTRRTCRRIELVASSRLSGFTRRPWQHSACFPTRREQA